MNTAREALYALMMQLPGLKSHITPGHYQLRIAGADVSENTLAQRLNDPLADGAVIHLVPRVAGAAKGGLLPTIVGAVMVVAGAVVIAFTGWTGVGGAIGSAMIAGGVGMMAGGVIQMLTPVPKPSSNSMTDNGKQNTYFSSLDNAVAQGNAVPVVYGEMVVGSRVVSQELTVWDE